LADELAVAVEGERPRHVDGVARLGPRRIGGERRGGALRNDDLIRHGSNSRFTSSMQGCGNGAWRPLTFFAWCEIVLACRPADCDRNRPPTALLSLWPAGNYFDMQWCKRPARA